MTGEQNYPPLPDCPLLATSRLNGFTAGATNQPEDWMPSARLAVDIGGTFTDLALEHDGRRSTIKVLTTPAAPEQGVMAGVRDILQTSGVAAADIGIVIHGTTLATNAVIERKGARTALLTTQGFRDVIAMGNESRYDQYDLNIVLPEPLVPRHLRLPIPERLDNEGNVLLPLDIAAVRALVPMLQREQVESIAVGLLHAFVNPAHERRVRDILAEELPDIPVSLSSEVSPEMREWERFSTTVANAYVQPLMARYLRELADGLRGIGVAGTGVPDAVGRRPDHDRHRLPLSDPPGGERSGRRRDLLGHHRAAMRHRQRAVVRHGRHHREDLPDRRWQAADRARLRDRARRAVPQRLRSAAADSGDRDGGDRRRRRLDRACRYDGPHRRRDRRAPAPIPVPPATAAAAPNPR